MLIPQHKMTRTIQSNAKCKYWATGASPNLPLTGDTLVTEGILIFEM